MLPSWPTAEARELQTPDPPAGVPHRCQKRDFFKVRCAESKMLLLGDFFPTTSCSALGSSVGGTEAEDRVWDTCPTVEAHLASWGQNNDTEKSQSLVWGQVG